ncbi:MAG: zinc-binding dehydrogenase [Patescibacteria group bacterium]
MKAAVLETLNKPLVVGEVTLTPLTPGQVLVKNLVTGICGAQLEEIQGHKGNAKFVPHLLGHEACGIVEDIGPEVQKVKKGDKVVLHWRKGEGIESDFPKYIYKGKEISSGKVTTFSEYTIVSENRVTPVPHDTPNDLAALLGCALSTGLGVVSGAAKVQPGESVIIIGAGGVGLNLIRAAVRAGANPVIAVDIADKETLAKNVGAHFFIHSGKTGLADGLESVAGIKNVDVIISTVTDKKTAEEALPLLAPSGRYVMVGQPVPGESLEITNAFHFHEGEGKVLMGTQSGGFNPTRDIPRYLKMAQEGEATIDGIITKRIKLDQINEAIDEIRAGKAGRIMIDF